jgi:hypothetical protein
LTFNLGNRGGFGWILYGEGRKLAQGSGTKPYDFLFKAGIKKVF